MKIALPWELGHTAAYLLSSGTVSTAAAWTGETCGVLACVVLAGYAVTLFVGSGRTPYDRLTGMTVVRR